MSAFARGLLLATAALAGVGPAARAHEFWLHPSRFVAQAGDTIAVRAFVGENLLGEVVPYRPPRVRRFEAVGGGDSSGNGGGVRDLRPGAIAGADPWVRFVLGASGGTHLLYDSEFASLTLEAARFDAYLAEEGLDSVLATRRAAALPDSGRERYRRCAKAWIAAAPETIPPPLGLEFEVVALARPVAGAPLSLEVRFRDRPLAGALVRAWREGSSSSAPAREGRTGPDGRLSLSALEPGVWLVHSVHMIPSADRAAADWESYWAAWTFEVTPATP